MVAANTRDPLLEPSHGQLLFPLNFFEETKIKKKQIGNGPFGLKSLLLKSFKIANIFFDKNAFDLGEDCQTNY